MARTERSAARQRPDMKAVAALAGVSAMTVSRALRAPDKVAAATRQRVEAAMHDLGYVPDLVASSLASRHSGIIAVIVPTVASSIFDDSVQGISDCIGAAGYQLIIGESRYSLAGEERLARAMLGRRPDGLILTGAAHTGALRDMLLQARLPVVETWTLTDTPIDSVVGFSNQAAGYAMTEALVAAGYQRIAFLGRSDESRSVARQSGYQRCLAAHGLSDHARTISVDSHHMAAAGRAVEALLSDHPATEAVFAASDSAAAGALFACQRRGWPVPGRIAIAGFGDFEIAAQTVPALTTVRIARYDIGRTAAQVILDRLSAVTAHPARLDFGFEIVRRESA